MILLPSPPHHCQPQHPLLVLLIEQCSILTSNTSVSMSNPAMQIFGLVMSSITIPFCHLLPHLTKFQKHQVKTTSKFPLTPMGVLAPGSAHARPSARPPFDMREKNYGAHVCRVTFKHPHQPLRSHIGSFRTLA